MKQLMKIFVITLSLSFLCACSSHTQNLSVKNSGMDSVSPTIKKNDDGFMQNLYDDFIKSDWEPTISKNEEIKEKYMKKDENHTNSFTLQEYVDKATAYANEKTYDENSSNVHKLEQMPVIGK